MTNPATTALAALRRADRGWCKETADEPLDAPRLDHLAAAVAAPAVDVDEHQAELDRVREFEEQRREDLRVELWKHIEVQQRRAERAERERDEARSKAAVRGQELDRWALALVDANRQFADARRDAGTWEGEFDRVVDDKLVELAEALEERDRARAERDQVLAELARVHQHAWDVQPGLRDMGLPCACGRPWPSTVRAQQAEAGAG